MSWDPKVILIGGAPGTGKSTIARSLAAQVGFDLVSTDDLGQAVRAVSSRRHNPDLFLMESADYRQYYQDHPTSELLDHALRAHRALWPGLEASIRAHATWSTPAVMEGWALLPHLVQKSEIEGVQAAWISVSAETIRERVVANRQFWTGAASPDLLINSFVERSVRFGEWLATETERFGLPFVDVEGIELREALSRVREALVRLS